MIPPTPKWWHEFDDVIPAVIKCVQGINWTWIANSRCKYIDLRIDMRDGATILMDRDGNKISIEELTYQHGRDND
jgi:hypothetical protein